MTEEIGRSVSISTLHTTVSVTSTDNKDTLERLKKIAESLLDKYKSQKG